MKVSNETLEAARAGKNTSCIDCRREPFWGGMRCWQCFLRRADERGAGKHGCPRHDPSSVCYNQCACRCEACGQIENDRRDR